MRTSIRALAAVAVVVLGVLGFTASALAAPVTLQFNVNISRLCDINAHCNDVSIDETMTYVFDDTIIGGYAFDLSTMSVHRSDFASAAMTMSGPLSEIAHPFGTETTDSNAWLYVNEGRDPAGSVFAQLSTRDARQRDELTTLPDGSTHQLFWSQRIEMFGTRRSETGGDGFASTTAADFVSELGLNSFFFSWNSLFYTQDCSPTAGCGPQLVDPRSFGATGTATLAVMPAVPEPTTLVLFGSGLVAVGARQKRRGRAQEYA